MTETLIQAILFGIPTAYVVHCLLLSERDSHFGPFMLNSVYVVFEGGNMQPAALFDIIRYVFGAYKKEVSGGVTFLKVGRWTDRWTCPYCLSFWVAILPATFFFSSVGIPMYVVSILTIAFVSAMLNHYGDYLDVFMQ